MPIKSEVSKKWILMVLWEQQASSVFEKFAFVFWMLGCQPAPEIVVNIARRFFQNNKLLSPSLPVGWLMWQTLSFCLETWEVSLFIGRFSDILGLCLRWWLDSVLFFLRKTSIKFFHHLLVLYLDIKSIHSIIWCRFCSSINMLIIFFFLICQKKS